MIPPFKELRQQIQNCDADMVRKALAAPKAGKDELAALLSPAAGELLPQLAARSAAITSQRFGKTIQLYAPLYLSNYCANRCLYCGFSADNPIKRKVLSIAEARDEAMILHNRGFNHILLVSGEAPAKVGVEYLHDLALLLRDTFAAISIEVQPLRREEYEYLFEAGITGVAVYQETYDREIYDKVHKSGPKCDFDFRLDTPSRVAAAGMREVGIGALLGLSDWRAEGLSLGYHLSWLRRNYWRTALTVSFPRMRPAAGEFEPLQPVSERNLSQLIFALRIFDPDVGLLLSTREEARFRNGMIGLGPTRYSAGSCTAPGGYSNPVPDGEQFSVGDLRSLDEVCNDIRQRGFDPVRKDWDSSFQMPGDSELQAA